MEYNEPFRNGYRISSNKKGIQIQWGISGYGGEFPPTSLQKNTGLNEAIKEFNGAHLLKQFDKIAAKYRYVSSVLVAFFLPLVLLLLALVLIWAIFNWDSRGVVFSFSFTLLAFIAFISAVFLVISPIVSVFLSKNAKEKIWRRLDVWFAKNGQQHMQQYPDLVLYHSTSVYRTISEELESRCVIKEKCQIVHIINLEKKH
ncbi:uncharacterized protein MONOS_2660 [Monocercomonoides exilis]|uniref:uncharacterized protein n=1 Tax=Monocercomonoides exilis TaxID=2049356 RepID=UPI003559F00E|nr:hypothetical protein MONOS_2660 [Monocercomonoides exilis]|eukprot:MONOS_2660.1-p1 / transcript=MONOS_2660.1 / gene=MONOS_2660 / organism=Monocercomonoides_exilis_PA203 / gene_product=unspecified product / transcript_product=unspecified product / location=Mono_scaffold00056:37589-38463(+) / protein_length=201 / sequence_SO=supercontig / SO=protein_coding / is_pseudo=false